MMLHQSITNSRSINFFNKLEDLLHAKHDKFYTYEEAIYKDSKTKMTITCPIHGNFEQTSSAHLAGRGCTKCGTEKTSKALSMTMEAFETNSRYHYGDKYDYSKVELKGNKVKVTVGCPIHGDFETTPNNHARGKAQCNKCKYDNMETSLWSYSDWKRAGEKSANFDSFKVYVIMCNSDTESFYKIGKTFTTTEKRFTDAKLPYRYHIVTELIGSAILVSKLENLLHTHNKQHKYTPDSEFPGSSECFTLSADLLELA